MKETTPIDRDRLGVITGALLLALALSRFLQMPMRPLNLARLGVNVVIPVSSSVLIAGIVAGMAISGMMSLVHSHPRARQEPVDNSFLYTIVPTLWALALALALPKVANLILWGMGLLGGGFIFALLLALEYVAVTQNQLRRPIWQWIYMTCVHLTALAYLTIIHAQHFISLIAGLLVWLVMTMLAIRFYWSNAGKPQDAVIYGSVVGILMAQMAWMLNHSRLSSLRAGLLLLVLFYVQIGLIQQQRLQRFNRQAVIEYGFVALLAVLLILLTVA